MYLESLTIENYRKFRNRNNVINFVEPSNIESMEASEEDSKSVIGPSTTLIIGKNNAGKTTIANALRLLCENSQLKSTDFNVDYISELHDKYLSESVKPIPLPELKFQLVAKVDMDKSDLMTNLLEFASVKGSGLSSVKINIKVEVSEATAFKDAISKFVKYVKDGNLPRNESITLLYDLLEQSSDFLELNEESKLFKIKYYDSRGFEAKRFSLKELINLREIKANRHLKDGILTDVFNKIVGFQFESDEVGKNNLEKEINNINETLTTSIESKSNNVSSVLRKIEDKSHVDLELKGNVTYDSLVRNLIKYNFSDNGDYIPESQFGLGYINLLNIIGEIIHYVDSYKKDSYNSTINLLFIEEPEAFMHPQMQEFFINRIDNAVLHALDIANKNSDDKKVLNCQIAITTHSSHIVNSKIHSSNSFDNINYLTVLGKAANVINLNDSIVSGHHGKESDELKFIKKHIKYKVSELFFSDAIIFVEGVTEEALLQYYIDNDDALKNSYISIFNINGAHGKVYLPLAKALKVPCLIITDLDIKRKACQKNINHSKDDDNCDYCGHKKGESDTQSVKEYTQISNLDKLITTNATIISFKKLQNGEDLEDGETTEIESSDSLEDLIYYTDENLHVVFQKDKINDFYATSLEEAFILTNYNNGILNETLRTCKPTTYKTIVGSQGSESLENLKSKSFEIQRKLSKSKSDFSSELLYRCIISEEKATPVLPQYIQDGFNWIKETLTSSTSMKSGDE
ncbi:AAA family ATPase [Photobacterium halotolerans]|uniref:AAA family ATPase n=1 Tax=Photobacterium halotolerans TaxID=265726 RepID=UPI000414648D|nr:AAA family ATPase [Photobacterium halotolerans]